LRPVDVDRPIHEIVSNLVYPDLIKDLSKVIETLVPKKIEIQSKNGDWYLVRILPYRTSDNVIKGVVMTCIDIAEIHTQKDVIDSLRRELELSRQFTQDVIEKARLPLVVLDAQLKVLSANRAFALFYKVGAQDIEGKSFFELGSRQWDISRVRQFFQRVLEGQSVAHVELEPAFEHAGPKRVVLIAAPAPATVTDSPQLLIAITEANGVDHDDVRR
jgi:two-component system CheB/CheR fusion protein